MSIELYCFPPSPRAFKPLVVANYLGLPFEIKMLDFRAGDLQRPDYMVMNPNMRMPTLKDGAKVVWESNAIMQYLAMKKPESGLLPTDDWGRLDVTRWQFWDCAHWDLNCATYLFEYMVGPMFMGTKTDMAVIEKTKPQFERCAKVLDDQLTGKKYVLGDKLTLADFTLAAPLIYRNEAHFPIENYGEIKRWFEGLSALPAWKKTYELAISSMPKAA